MKINLLAFGIAKDVLGKGQMDFVIDGPQTVGQLKDALVETYPAFKDLASFRIAVNETYAKDDQSLEEGDEVVIIPPVSGG